MLTWRTPPKKQGMLPWYAALCGDADASIMQSALLQAGCGVALCEEEGSQDQACRTHPSLNECECVSPGCTSATTSRECSAWPQQCCCCGCVKSHARPPVVKPTGAAHITAHHSTSKHTLVRVQTLSCRLQRACTKIASASVPPYHTAA